MCSRLVIKRSQVQSPPGPATFFVAINHGIFSVAILSHLLMQEGQLSVSGERICTSYVHKLED